LRAPSCIGQHIHTDFGVPVEADVVGVRLVNDKHRPTLRRPIRSQFEIVYRKLNPPSLCLSAPHYDHRKHLLRLAISWLF
jgi:hypothetical protein